MITQVLQKQKIWTSLVAIGLAIIITIFAAYNSFGVTSNDDLNEEERIEMEILNRAYADLQPEAIIKIAEPVQKIKIFNSQNELVAEAVLNANQLIEDKKVKHLLNKAQFLSQYGSLSVYRISE
ncbi:MAG: hypothetical protein ACI905_002433 [Roseivirga sp.]|jgi:hypothetical protein